MSLAWSKCVIWHSLLYIWCTRVKHLLGLGLPWGILHGVRGIGHVVFTLGNGICSLWVIYKGVHCLTSHNGVRVVRCSILVPIALSRTRGVGLSRHVARHLMLTLVLVVYWVHISHCRLTVHVLKTLIKWRLEIWTMVQTKCLQHFELLAQILRRLKTFNNLKSSSVMKKLRMLTW